VEPIDVSDYQRINKANWDSRVPHHERGYDLQVFTDDPSHLSQVVQFDLSRLGELAGLRGVHLQCHIGTDTVSLARLGAHMTGLDFSGPALGVAARLAAASGALASPELVSFNHSLSEIFNALWDAGMTITLFEEHQSVPWNPLAEEMVEDEMGEFRLREKPERLAATYTLRAVKN